MTTSIDNDDVFDDLFDEISYNTTRDELVRTLDMGCTDLCFVLNMMIDRGVTVHCKTILGHRHHPRHSDLCHDCIRTYKNLFRASNKDIEEWSKYDNLRI